MTAFLQPPASSSSFHLLLNNDAYRREFPASYRELLLETCQEFDRECTRDIVRIYSENAPELSIGTHIDRMLALESALEMEEANLASRLRAWEGAPYRYVAAALNKVRDNIHELSDIAMGGAR